MASISWRSKTIAANPTPNLDVRIGLNTLPSLFTESARQQNLTRLVEENQYIKAVEIESKVISQWATDFVDSDHVLYQGGQ